MSVDRAHRASVSNILPHSCLVHWPNTEPQLPVNVLSSEQRKIQKDSLQFNMLAIVYYETARRPSFAMKLRLFFSDRCKRCVFFEVARRPQSGLWVTRSHSTGIREHLWSQLLDKKNGAPKTATTITYMSKKHERMFLFFSCGMILLASHCCNWRRWLE